MVEDNSKAGQIRVVGTFSEPGLPHYKADAVIGALLNFVFVDITPTTESNQPWFSQRLQHLARQWIRSIPVNTPHLPQIHEACNVKRFACNS